MARIEPLGINAVDYTLRPGVRQHISEAEIIELVVKP